MKKIFTLALTLFILNAAFSQTVVSRFSVQTPGFGISYDRNNGNGYYTNNNYYNDNYGRSFEIQKINADYNQSVQQVMCLHIGAGRKIQLINQLQKEKFHKLRRLNRRCFDDGNNSGYQSDNNNYNWNR